MNSLSIIIPVYNAESTIKRTIDSILELEFKNYEVIIIDDGSKDNTYNIVKEYINNYANIRYLVNKENKGVSFTRNRGIDESLGDYLTFIDAGDTVNRNTYNELSNDFLFDAMIFGFNRIEGAKINKHPLNFGKTVLDNCDIIRLIIPRMIAPLKIDNTFETVMGSVWRIIFKKNILIENQIIFYEDLKVAEDLLFCIDFLIKCKNIFVIEDCFYNYIREVNSSIEKYYPNNFQNSIKVANRIEERVKKLLEKNISIKLRFNVYLFYLCSWEISCICRSNLKYREKLTELKIINEFFTKNRFDKDIFKELNMYRKIVFILLKCKQYYVLLFCFSIKEKIRLNRYNKK